jgi:hypothetical protein
MEHLKYVSEILAKTTEKSFQNICNIQIKTLATYVWKNR